MGDHAIRMDFPETNFCDMGGAIRLATAVMPEVQRITTFHGGFEGTEYRKAGGQWEAIPHRNYAEP